MYMPCVLEAGEGGGPVQGVQGTAWGMDVVRQAGVQGASLAQRMSAGALLPL
jgi:hypothetical protein